MAQKELRQEKQVGGPVNCSDSELCTFLRGLEEGFLPTYYSDTSPSVQSKSMNIASKSYQLGKKTVVFHGFPSLQMSRSSTDGRGTELLTLFLAASLARTFRRPAKAQDLTASAPDCGRKWRELSVRYDRNTSSWRTHRSLWDEGLSACSLTLPSWGMTLVGVCWEPTTPAPPTRESESGLWPTPCAGGNQTGGPVGLGGGSAARAKLLEICKDEQEAKAMGCGKLNPNFAEWLLGWPINWTSIEPQDCAESAMGRFQQWRQWHSGFFRNENKRETTNP